MSNSLGGTGGSSAGENAAAMATRPLSISLSTDTPRTPQNNIIPGYSPRFRRKSIAGTLLQQVSRSAHRTRSRSISHEIFVAELGSPRQQSASLDGGDMGDMGSDALTHLKIPIPKRVRHTSDSTHDEVDETEQTDKQDMKHESSQSSDDEYDEIDEEENVGEWLSKENNARITRLRKKSSMLEIKAAERLEIFNRTHSDGHPATLEEELEMVQAELEEREQELELAAEIGQMLLEKDEANASKLSFLEAELQREKAFAEEAQHEQSTLRRKMASTRVQIVKLEEVNLSLTKEIHEKMDTITELQRDLVSAKSRARSLSSEKSRRISDTALLAERLEREREDQAEAIAEARLSKELEHQAITNAIATAEAPSPKHTALMEVDEKVFQEQRATIDELRERIWSLEAEAEMAMKVARDLETANKVIGEHEVRSLEFQKKNKDLATNLQQIHVENKLLNKQMQEQQDLLDSLRTTVDEYKNGMGLEGRHNRNLSFDTINLGRYVILIYYMTCHYLY